VEALCSKLCHLSDVDNSSLFQRREKGKEIRKNGTGMKDEDAKDLSLNSIDHDIFLLI
jgi:hypothetical protein